MQLVVYSAPKVNIIFKIIIVFHDIFLFFACTTLLFVNFWPCWLEILKSGNLGFSGSSAASSAGCTAF